MNARDVKSGCVYIGRNDFNWRRVVDVRTLDYERGKHKGRGSVVIYSTGTDRNRHCLLKNFARWALQEVNQGVANVRVHRLL